MEQTKENKMGTMPVNKLLVTMSLPMVISMIVQALYNIVDSIFAVSYTHLDVYKRQLQHHKPPFKQLCSVWVHTCLSISL